jgi:hypothetical protein
MITDLLLPGLIFVATDLQLHILLRGGMQLHDVIISLRGDFCVHKTSLASPLAVLVLSQKNDQRCICLLVTLIFDLGTVPKAFLKKWWVESDFKAPNLPLSL